MSNIRRVVVTGMGVVSAIGSNLEEFHKSLVEGKCGTRENTFHPDMLRGVKNVGYASGFVASEHFPKHLTGTMDPFVQFALVAARAALQDAGISLDDIKGERTAVIMGTGTGGMETLDEAYRRYFEMGKTSASPTTLVRAMYNAAASHISIEMGITGPTVCLSTACATGTHSIAWAAMLIRAGMVDVAIAGGSEAVRSLGLLKGWESMRVLSDSVCRPFAKGRDGLVLGEGAGVVILESAESAVARKARIYAELAGLHMNADAKNMTNPSLDGAVACMAGCMRDANADLIDVDHINAHGTGTRANDANEALAIRTLFGSHADDIAVASTKAMHGHALGAAGGIEAIASCLSLYHSFVPATINVDEVDTDCDINLVVGESRKIELGAVLKNSFGFGGLNASLLFKCV